MNIVACSALINILVIFPPAVVNFIISTAVAVSTVSAVRVISCAGEVPPTKVPAIVIASAAVYPPPPAFNATELIIPFVPLTTSNVAPDPVPPVDATPV